MRIIYTIILASLLIASTIFGGQTSGVGSSGAQFLEIGVGSKYQGMGEASVAIVDDVYSMYWNPAGLAQIESGAIGFTNVSWLAGVDLNYVAFAKSFEEVGVFGISVTVLSMDEIEITTFENQGGTGEYYSASSYAVGASFARRLTNRFAFGGTVKYVGEKIHNLRSSAIGFDFGTTLEMGFNSLRLGMSISNMGPDLKFSGSDLDIPYDPLQGDGQNGPVGAELKTTPYALPMSFRLGLAYDFDFGPQSVLTVTSELKHPNDNERQASMGAQWAFKDQFFLRSGYKFNYEEEGLAFGGGFTTSVGATTSLKIDYAWQDFGRLDNTQRFSVGFTF